MQETLENNPIYEKINKQKQNKKIPSVQKNRTQKTKTMKKKTRKQSNTAIYVNAPINYM